jgi:hypothetical protein
MARHDGRDGISRDKVREHFVLISTLIFFLVPGVQLIFQPGDCCMLKLRCLRQIT